MYIAGLFGRYPKGNGGVVGDAFIYEYEPCDSEAGLDDIVFLNQAPGTSILIGTDCYTLTRARAIDTSTYPGVGDTPITDPVPTIDNTFGSCVACVASLPYEQWKKCVDDTDAAVLTDTHTDVDYAWLCIGGVWVKCYNASQTAATPTDPTVLKQCGTTPISCATLVGWPASDSFSGTGCDSTAVDDDTWTVRWDVQFKTTVAISGGNLVMTDAESGSGAGPFVVSNISGQTGDIEGTCVWTGSWPANGAVFSWQFDISGNPCWLQIEADSSGTRSLKMGFNGSTVVNELNSATGGTFRFDRVSGITKMYFDGVLKYTSGTNNGSITNLGMYTSAANSGQTLVITASSVTIDDSAGSDIIIDPSGVACT